VSRRGDGNGLKLNDFLLIRKTFEGFFYN